MKLPTSGDILDFAVAYILTLASIYVMCLGSFGVYVGVTSLYNKFKNIECVQR